MTHRIEFTTLLPDGRPLTVGIDVAGDHATADDACRRVTTLATILTLYGRGRLGTVQHQRGPFAVPTEGTQP